MNNINKETLPEVSVEVKKAINRIREIAGGKGVIIAFSGGLDSTVVLNLAIKAISNDKIVAANVDFGTYAYQKARDNVQMICQSLQIKLLCISGISEQIAIMRGGPDCNLCTKKVKLGKIKRYARGQIILTGSNQSDSWGKYGFALHDGYYAPLFHYSKKEITVIAHYLDIAIKHIGENENREGCKLKHLLKPLINTSYHGQAVSQSNELLLNQIEQSGMTVKIANVKIIGPLHKNIALVNIYPLPDQGWLRKIKAKIEQINEIDECMIVDQPIELIIKANKGQFNNLHSRYWIEKGRLQPEFAFPIKTRWLLTTNRKLKTFQIVDYNDI